MKKKAVFLGTTNQKGYSIVELIVVIALFVTIASFVSSNLLEAQQGTSLATTESTLIADTKNQQIKAMSGDTEGRVANDYYGVHFDVNSYTLFHGTTYNPNDSANQTINLDPVLKFVNNTFTNGNLIFIPTNGEVYGYSSLTNSISLNNSVANQQKILQFNYLGVLTQD